MFLPLLVIMACTSSLFAQDITVSKDALWVYNSINSSKADALPRRGSITTCLFLDSLDFSLINDSCEKRITTMETCTFNTCAVAVPDVRIRDNSILAPQGVLFLGTSSDTGCLDTLKRIPQSGYLDSVGFGYSGGYLFAVKTSEMNYAALHLITSGSGLPFRYFKWVYQSDGSPQFIKETSAKMVTRETTTNLRHVESILKRGKITVSWAPLPGAVQFNLFDLNGRQLYAWEADGRQGTAVVPVKYSKLPSSTLILHLQVRNGAETGQVCHIIIPR